MNRVESSTPTAILLTADDARRFESEQPAVGAIMTLSPVAQAALSDESRTRHVREPLSDWSHARITARAHRATQQFVTALEASNDLRPGTRHTLRFMFLIHAYLTARVWETLRQPGPWLWPTGQGWDTTSDRTVALHRLVDHLNPYLDYDRPPPLRGLYRLLRRLVLRVLRRRGPWLLTRRPNLVFGLDEMLDAEQPPMRRLMLTLLAHGPREYRNLLHTLKDGLSGKAVLRVAMTAHNAEAARPVIARALDQVREPVIALGVTPKSRAMFLHQGTNCEGLFADALDVLGAIAPRSYVTRQDSGKFAVIADAAGVLGVPRFVINYNSFPVSSSRIANTIQREMFRVRVPDGLSDTAVMWSPHMAATARCLYGTDGAVREQAMRLAPTNARRPNGNNRVRRVLYAGNYMEYYYFVPWVMETSNEFLDDILTLVEHVRALNNVDFTVRVKPKGECPPEALRKFIQETDRLHVTGTERPYVEVVTEVDLLVSFSSTTIEQAILRRTPVLLWGPLQRYRHLPGRVTPPTADSRAAVYAVSDAANLSPMISAILDAHAGYPLTDQEIADHVWPEGTPGVPDIARMIVAGARPQ